MDPDRFAKHARLWIHAINHHDDGLFHRDIANVIRNFIFDVGQRSTGYVSEEASQLRASQRCKEHFHSRLNVGLHIVDKIREGKWGDTEYGINRIYQTIFSACRVHNTTSEENRKLISIQNGPETKDLGWRAQYRLAGIKLYYTGSVFEYEGCRYIGYSEGELAEHFGVTVYKFRKHYKKYYV